VSLLQVHSYVACNDIDVVVVRSNHRPIRLLQTLALWESGLNPTRPQKRDQSLTYVLFSFSPFSRFVLKIANFLCLFFVLLQLHSKSSRSLSHKRSKAAGLRLDPVPAATITNPPWESSTIVSHDDAEVGPASLPEAKVWCAEYDIASLFLVSFYCFVTKACTRRPGAAASAAPCLLGRQAS
jgi:hypothetical protein